MTDNLTEHIALSFGFAYNNQETNKGCENMQIEGAIFDFDGTLFDSMAIWQDLGMKYLQHLGFEAGEEISALFFNMSTRRAIMEARKRYAMTMSEQEIADGLNAFLQIRYLNEGKPKNDIIKFLDKLKNAGVKMCIATASDVAPVSAALKKYDMLGYFSEIFSVSSVGKGKGSPDIFRTALSFLETKKEKTWIFEDALYAARTAKADGFNLVGVYDESEPGKDELKELADIYIEKYEELYTFLSEF